MRLVVVGGGIVGVAVARLLAREYSDAEVLLIEKEAVLAAHQSAHNSGVVHAGIYYEPGSLKARLCRRGGELLRELCEQQGLAYAACGKVVIARDKREIDALQRLAERASANDVPGLRWLDEAELRAVEPHAAGVAGLHSPTSASVDFAAVTRALAEQFTASGGTIRTSTALSAITPSPGGAALVLASGERVAADRVVVCAGLQADRLARASGEPATRKALTRFIPASVPSALAGRCAPTMTTGWATLRVRFRKNPVSSSVAVPCGITKPAIAGSSRAI